MNWHWRFEKLGLKYCKVDELAVEKTVMSKENKDHHPQHIQTRTKRNTQGSTGRHGKMGNIWTQKGKYRGPIMGDNNVVGDRDSVHDS